MKKYIRASSDVDKIEKDLIYRIGSRLDPTKALLVNLGDGDGGLVYEDPGTGDIVLMRIPANFAMSADAARFISVADVENAIIETWDESY